MSEAVYNKSFFFTKERSYEPWIDFLTAKSYLLLLDEHHSSISHRNLAYSPSIMLPPPQKTMMVTFSVRVCVRERNFQT